MTWQESKVALQLEAEERLGAVLRMREEYAQAQEDAAVKKTLEAIGGRG